MLGRSAPCLHHHLPAPALLVLTPPAASDGMGWDGKGVSNPGCREEPVCCSCPWTWEASPSCAGGHSTGDQPQQSELPLCPRSRPHPRCASTPAPPLPRAAIASPACKTQLALLRSGHSTELPRQRRPGHGRGLGRAELLELKEWGPRQGFSVLLPSCSVHLPSTPRLSRPSCSSRQRNTAPCRNQPG